MSTILITGARAPIALDLARSFAAAGHDVHLADSVRPWTARLARGMRLHRFAPPRFAFAQFVRDFGDLVAKLEPVLIVPTCEEVFYVAEAAARLGLSNRVFAPRPDMLRRLHSKVTFPEVLAHAGVAAPGTRRAVSVADLEPARSGELVFKPEFSRFASHALVRPDAAAVARIKPTAEAPWAVQDFVAGEEICIWSAARAGEIVAFAAYKPRWRLGRSASFYFENERDPALLETARKIARSIDATGQLSFDVIRRDDGTIVPIECNPRGISGIHLFDSDAGLARALLGEGGIAQPAAEARHLGPAMWLLGAPQALLQGRFGALRDDMKRSGDVFARRPSLAFGALLDAGRFAMVGLSRGRSASGQSTDDIEWNGEPMA